MIEILGHVHLDAPVADCQHCPKTGLRHLVRVRIDGADKLIGVGCAARITGTTTAVVRTRATKADKDREQAIYDTWLAWRFALLNFRNSAMHAAMTTDVLLTSAYLAAEKEWMAEHPKPPCPAGKETVRD